jgi:hypothetical protein
MRGVRFIVALAAIAGVVSAGVLTIGQPKAQSAPKAVAKRLSMKRACELAARLANDKAEVSFGARPFRPTTYPAVLKDHRWTWGHYSPAGAGGISAEVSFSDVGSDARVEVWLTGDFEETLE